jgi:hypothetical protein
MLLEQVALGHQLAQVPGTRINIRDLFAISAMEMMVVMPMDLITICFTRKAHHINHTVSDQALDISVNRGEAEVGH